MTARRFKSERHTALGMAFPSEAPNRLHSLGCRPPRMPKGNAVQRAARRVVAALLAAWVAWMKPATEADVDSWADRGMR